MLSNFKTKCVKMVVFSIIQEFPPTDVDALTPISDLPLDKTLF